MATMWLAKHTIPEVTAKVPFAMILLEGKAKSNEIPPELCLRLLVPSAGLCSISLWGAASAAEVESYCKETIGDFCETEVFEVYQEACFGFADLVAPTTMAEKFQEKTRQVASAVDAKVIEVDEVLQQTATSVAQNATETIAKLKESFQSESVAASISQFSSAFGSFFGGLGASSQDEEAAPVEPRAPDASEAIEDPVQVQDMQPDEEIAGSTSTEAVAPKEIAGSTSTEVVTPEEAETTTLVHALKPDPPVEDEDSKEVSVEEELLAALEQAETDTKTAVNDYDVDAEPDVDKVGDERCVVAGGGVDVHPVEQVSHGDAPDDNRAAPTDKGEGTDNIEGKKKKKKKKSKN